MAAGEALFSYISQCRKEEALLKHQHKALCTLLCLAALLIPAGVMSAGASAPVPVDTASPVTLTQTDVLSGKGTVSLPYLIQSEEDLAFLSERVNAGDSDYTSAYYRQTTSLTLSAHTPIGTKDSPFCGVYDGDGHSVTLSFDIPPNNQNCIYGLFGYAQNASFYRIVVCGDLDVTTSCTSSGLYTGLLCASYLANVAGDYEVRDCEALGSISSSSKYYSAYAGSLIAYVKAVKGNVYFTDCYADSTLSVDGERLLWVGGLVAQVSTDGGCVFFERCAANSRLQNNARCQSVYMGGLVGYFTQNELGWISTASLSETRYSFSNCLVLGSLQANAKREIHCGSLTGYWNSIYDNKNVYSALSADSTADTTNTGTTTAMSADALLAPSFLSDTLGFSLSDKWIAIEDASGLRLESKHPELLLLSATSTSSLRFQPVNCPRGTWAIVFEAEDTRMKGVRLAAPMTANTFTVRKFTPYASVRAQLFDPLTLKPLLASTFSFET